LVTIAGATYHLGAFIAAWTTYGTLKIEVNIQGKGNTRRIFADKIGRVNGPGEHPV
jgi:hypothetical protein